MKTLIGISMALLISISAYSENTIPNNDKNVENDPAKTEVATVTNSSVVAFDFNVFMAIYNRSLQNVDSVCCNKVNKIIKKNSF